MRKINYKGRCEKCILSKCKTMVKTYDSVQASYAEALENNFDIVEIQCNIPLEDDTCNDYMTDFLCKKSNGDMMVRECIHRKYLVKPLSAKLLDMSRNYWLRRGVTDWGIVTDADEE